MTGCLSGERMLSPLIGKSIIYYHHMMVSALIYIIIKQKHDAVATRVQSDLVTTSLSAVHQARS